MNTQKETVLRTAAQEARALLFLSKAQSKVLENKQRAKEPFPYQGAPFPYNPCSAQNVHNTVNVSMITIP
jgi:hypothetical protein